MCMDQFPISESPHDIAADAGDQEDWKKGPWMISL